jgi:hypothetical protein
MNERTKQLWEESQHWNGSDDGRGGLKILESVEKFAELIVQECANAIVNDSRLSDVRTARNGCVRTIKERFGVK